MNLVKKLGVFCLLSLFSLSGMAQSQDEQELSQFARSAGKQFDDQSIDLETELKTRQAVRGKRREETVSQARSVANRHDQYFSIYDADVELLSDIDRDGFHHRLNVIFDVDVNYDGATLYAKLYLSREDGPWIQYATTNLFDIYENDTGDTYEITTELIEGYPPGYYAVLVEIYSLNHGYMVTSEILDRYYLGQEVKLEDLYRDEVVVYEEVEIVETHGGGSFTLFLWLLLVQVVIAARGVLSLSPRKTTIRRMMPLSCGPFDETRKESNYTR